MKILLVVYDNDSYIHWFPQGLGYIAAVARQAGHEVKIYNQDQQHLRIGNPSALTSPHYTPASPPLVKFFKHQLLLTSTQPFA